ncbi:MAG: sodium:proton antiporter [Gemmatimonadales bacterium]|nr:sodium:proton antiporter [Gemmatimonadales bacterium]
MVRFFLNIPPRLPLILVFTVLLSLGSVCVFMTGGSITAWAHEHDEHPADQTEAAVEPSADHSHDHGQLDGHSHSHDNDHGDVHGDGHGHAVSPVGLLPLWTVIPFVGILLSIALGPLVAPHFWHHHFPKISAFWALLFAVPFLIWNVNLGIQEILHIYFLDYFPFIILLWGLFTISGGIYVGGSLRGSPVVNLVLLIIGTFLASLIGTTGAAMVLIRPILRANEWRQNKLHLIVFFIFLVANIGGSLTPLGDPPLFLGFLHGVPFFWVTTGLLPHMLLAVGLILAVFFVMDTILYRREDPNAIPVADPNAGGIKIEGLHNILFLLGVMGAVIMSGSLKLDSVTLYTGGNHPVAVPLQNWLKDAIIILMGILSLRTTAKKLREKNGFSWFPIQEVAYLFAGIFMTIIPALAILKAGSVGAMADLTNAVHGPVRYFWATGILSAFLDNAPTYLTFFNAALGDLGKLETDIPGMLGYLGESLRHEIFIKDLTAISAGAVFMGAMTYIGNAPNFMVKAIAEEAGIPMPSFFGYLIKWSVPILLPIFVIITFVFFA